MNEETIEKHTKKRGKKRKNILFPWMVMSTARFLPWLPGIPALSLKAAEVLLLRY